MRWTAAVGLRSSQNTYEEPVPDRLRGVTSLPSSGFAMVPRVSPKSPGALVISSNRVKASGWISSKFERLLAALVSAAV